MQGARRLRDGLVGLLVWRSLQGLGRWLWITDRAMREVLGRLARIPLFGLCMACGLVLDASYLAGELVCGCRLALAGPWPCMTHKNELAATGQEPFKWLYRIYKATCQAPVKISTRADLRHPLATVLRSALSPPAKTGGGSAAFPQKSGKARRKERYFAPSGTSNDLPNVLIGASNAQHLMRIFVPGTGTLPVWGRFGGGRSAPSKSRRHEG